MRKGDNEILYIDNEKKEVMVTLNHNLYGNEYMEYPIDWVSKKFKSKC